MGAGVAALIALGAALLTMTADPVGVFLDDAIYVATAQAIAAGDGFVLPFLPEAPPAVHFPPGWPLLLAAVWTLFPEFPGNVAVLKLLNPLLLAVAAALAARWGATLPGLNAMLSAAVVAVAVVAVPLLTITGVLFSEPLFLVGLLLTLLVTARAASPPQLLLAGVLAGCTVLVRSVGLALVLATVVAWCWERRWRDVAWYLGTVGIVLAPWQWYVARVSGRVPAELGGMYWAYSDFAAGGGIPGAVAPVTAVVAHNLGRLWEVVAASFFPWGGALRHPVAALVIGAGVLGLAALGRDRSTRVAALTVVLYLGAILAWPFEVSRFVFGIWPVLLLVAAVGVRRGAALVPGGARAPGAVVVVTLGLVLGGLHLTNSALGHSRGWATAASARMTRTSVPFVRAVVDEPRLAGRVLATEAAPMVGLYTGARVVPVERFLPAHFLQTKSESTFVADLEAIDRRYQPGAYLVLRGGVMDSALTYASLGDRRLVDVTPPGALVRTLLVQTP
jgi:hypothetical protein